jgi:hypothetical protein
MALGAILLSSVWAQPLSGLAAAAAQVPVRAKAAGSTQSDRAQPFKLPKEISLVLAVEELPGMANPRSFWEVAYDIRIADKSAVMAKPELADVPDFGESLLQSSFAKRSFLEADDRHLTISLPMTGRLRQRLEQQSDNPQVFLLRSTVRLFDARLDRQFVLKVNRLWQFRLFPDGSATITIKIAPDGSYSTWGPVPKVLPRGYSIMSLPSNPKPVMNP